MKKIKETIYKAILPEKLDKNNIQKFHRGKTIAITLLLLIILTGSLYILDIFNAEYNAPFPYITALVILSIFLALYKITNSLFLIGNVVALSFYCIFSYQSYTPHYIFSDALLWLIPIPLFAYFMINKNTGIFWTIAVFIMFSFYYFLTIQNQVEHFYTPIYYYISIVGVLLLITGIAFSYKLLQDEMYQEIISKKDEIEQQKEVLYIKNQKLLSVSNKLKDSNQELQNFAHTTAHDLKQPMRSINNFAQLLQINLRDEINEESNEYINQIISSSQNLHQLIESILSFSEFNKSLNQQSIQLENTDINEICLHIENSLSKQIEDTKAEIIYKNKLPLITANRNMMARLLQNLISNAIKYHKDNVPPIIKLNFSEDAQFWRFSISDNGIGIPNDSLNDIFMNFHKLNTKKQGHGIGLAICKKIVEKHGGKLSVHSELGIGSTFYFSIAK